jgi:hypothetical protein
VLDPVQHPTVVSQKHSVELIVLFSFRWPDSFHSSPVSLDELRLQRVNPLKTKLV